MLSKFTLQAACGGDGGRLHQRVLVDARQQSMYLSGAWCNNGAEYLPLVQTSSGAEHQWCKVCRVQVLVAHSALGTGRVVA